MYRNFVFLIFIGLLIARPSHATDFFGNIAKAEQAAKETGAAFSKQADSAAKAALTAAAKANGVTEQEALAYAAQQSGTSAAAITSSAATTFPTTATVSNGTASTAASTTSTLSNTSATVAGVGAGLSSQREALNKMLPLTGNTGQESSLVAGVLSQCVEEFAQNNPQGKMIAWGMISQVTGMILAEKQDMTVANACARMLIVAHLPGIDSLQAATTGRPIPVQQQTYSADQLAQQNAANQFLQAQADARAAAAFRAKLEEQQAKKAKEDQEDEALKSILTLLLTSDASGQDISNLIQNLEQAL